MYFSREISISKAFGSSLSSLYSKLSSRRIFFPTTAAADDTNPPAALEDSSPSSSQLHPDDQPESPEARAARVKSIVRSLYKSLAHHHCGPTPDDRHVAEAAASTEDCQQVMASDLEWWFHGPPGCDYMMRMLTGQAATVDQSSSSSRFKFEPRSIEVIGDCVIAEGWEGEVYWVHVWTVRDDGLVITQFREYFNTWLTVKDVTGRPAVVGGGHGRRRSTASQERERITLWRSRPADLYKRSLPGLVLAI